MRRLFVVIICLVCLFVVTSNCSATYASTNQTKVEKQRAEIRQKINFLSKLERQESSKLNKNQQKLEKNQKALENSKKQYDRKQDRITDLQKDLNMYLNQYNNRQSASAERIRTIYKTKHTLIIDLLLTTNSITQFLDRIYYQNLIIQSDKKKMKELKEEAKRIAYLKQKLEKERKELSGIIKVMNKENSNIQKTIRQNKSIIDKIKKDKRAYERSERELRRLSDNLTTIISKSTKDSEFVATSGFILPVQGARISSPYGYRIHPIFKTKNFHSGIDYAAPYGTPIKASNAGKVIYSGWYGGYGKVVILDHGSCTGSPTTTLYAHMSSRKVSVGQTVQRGQVVGLIGTTGYATGPHLHFEVRINGKHTNPKRFL